MIPHRLRPFVGLPRTLAMLAWLKLFHRATGWKYFFASWSVLRLDGGRLIFGGGNWIESGVLLQACGGELRLGVRTFVNRGTVIVCRTGIDIGDDVVIADHCTIIDHDHVRTGDDRPWGRRGYVDRPIRIGKGAWLASHVVVLKGVTIGDHAVIAAGAVVTKDVPAGQVWGGVPARALRHTASEVG